MVTEPDLAPLPRAQIDDSEDEKAKREELKAAYEPLCRLIKDILADKVEKVREKQPPVRAA
jgi:HSP90 family molecular chaperone